MVALIVALAAAVLVHGWIVGSRIEVGMAGLLSLAGIVLLLTSHRRRPPEPLTEPLTEPGAVPEPAPEPAPEPQPDVVFVPGRLTFHDAECPMVREKPVSSARREHLATGGMKPCRRCLAPPARAVEPAEPAPTGESSVTADG